MKKVVLFLFVVLFSVSIFATSTSPKINKLSDLSDINGPRKNDPVGYLDLGENLQTGSPRTSNGEYIISICQYPTYLQVDIKQSGNYSIRIENSDGEVYSTVPVNKNQSSVSIPTVFYPDDSYKVTFCNEDGTSLLFAEFNVGE